MILMQMIGKVLMKQANLLVNRSFLCRSSSSSFLHRSSPFFPTSPYLFMMSIQQEVIELSSDDSLASSPPRIKKDPSPAPRRGKQGQGQHISSTKPGKLQLGQAAQEKQHHQDLIAARGRKTGIDTIPSYLHFSISITCCIYDEFGDKD